MATTYNLEQISAFIFDVDGVLTDGILLAFASGEQVRGFNIKDGFAIRHAIKKGYVVAIISGRNEVGVRKRLESLDITEIYLGVENKVELLNALAKKYNLDRHQMAYMGDDVPDLGAMQLCGVAACPADAVTDVKEVANYIAKAGGGQGAARELIELVLKQHKKW